MSIQNRSFSQKDEPEETPEYVEKVVHINRCAKVVKGGRRFSFAALVVVGNQKGEVGVGYGKAKEVPECIRKGTEQAKKNLVKINLRNDTIPHHVLGEADGGKVLLRPASDGTGVIAGGGCRAVALLLRLLVLLLLWRWCLRLLLLLLLLLLFLLLLFLWLVVVVVVLWV